MKPRAIVWIKDGYAFLKIDGGWLILGTEDEWTPLDVPAQFAMIHARLQGPHWHAIPERLN
jgi:hypothetical protein